MATSTDPADADARQRSSRSVPGIDHLTVVPEGWTPPGDDT